MKTATLPKKTPPQFLRWGQVVRLCENMGLSERDARLMFRGVDNPARKVLPERTTGVYIRLIVLKKLDLPTES